MREVWRDYVIRKYVRARSASEAIELSKDSPVIEVNEMQNKPEPSNAEVCTPHVVGFNCIGSEE